MNSVQFAVLDSSFEASSLLALAAPMIYRIIRWLCTDR